MDKVLKQLEQLQQVNTHLRHIKYGIGFLCGVLLGLLLL